MSKKPLILKCREQHLYVALRGTPGVLDVPCPCSFGFYGCFKVIFRGCALDAPCPKHINLFSDVTSLNDAVMSSMTSQCCACIGHVTFEYERSINASVGVLTWSLSVRQV